MIVQEGLFLYTHNVSPYDGGVFHQAPLLLPLFALIPPSIFSALTALLYVAVDLLCAHALIQIAESGEAAQTRLFTSPRKDIKWDSLAVGAGWVIPKASSDLTTDDLQVSLQSIHHRVLSWSLN